MVNASKVGRSIDKWSAVVLLGMTLRDRDRSVARYMVEHGGTVELGHGVSLDSDGHNVVLLAPSVDVVDAILDGVLS